MFLVEEVGSFFVSHSVSGGDLFERLEESDFILSETDCQMYVRQICEGLAYMHRHNVVHLDLKPENILCVTRKSQDIRIMDFGLSQRLEAGKKIRVRFGTAEFCPPEVVNYQPIGFQSDCWSLGVITYIL